MSKLEHIHPKIIDEKVTDEGVELTLWVDAELDYFKGHFPNVPILAGVAQLNWAVELGAQKLNLPCAKVKDVEVLKFQEVITPNTTLTLALSQTKSNKFTFRYASEKGVHASGRVVLDLA
ncbi:ApeI family dehydratase [Thalassotalea fusca]